MNHSPAMRTAVLLAAFASAGAFAQPAPTPAPGIPEVGATRAVTDVGPAPAEERDSIGAIVLDTSPVRAQREAFGSRQASLRPDSIGRGVMRTSTRARVKEDVAQAREDEAIGLYQRGAGSITPR
jgi:hypothetical protein